ncbi:IclR family transcriptional regulator [Microbacterium betulae]|uniref:Glycerol operon regulatory protein n=1 Tax=Microbacterium betulae TaxID=2981139 RepID=A0AA97FH75_9MICO|nr:IclR family transcriptional regulator [Microbacterium sp. AB]WOF23108.1 IclR family transcriptional regulator [Microbacterium sp. AB]
MTPEPGAPASTTERVARILMAFGRAGQPLGVSEVARACDLSKAVVHRILQTLVREGLLRADAGSRKYALGPAALALGQEAARGDALRSAAMPVISHLAEVTGETTTVTERVGHGRHYVGQIESFRPIRITIRIGDQVPLWSGASGLSILAFMDDDDVDYVLGGELTAFTEATVTDPIEIRERLTAIRERGWAKTAGERVPFSSSIAAPIFDVDGTPAGSLSIAILADRADGHAEQELSRLVVTSAADASTRLQRIRRGVESPRRR